jgi:hypothetical protein
MGDLFGPLHLSYCKYFYILSIFSFFSFIACLLGCGYNLLNKKKMNVNVLLVLVNSFFGYFVNRLLYSMCVGSLINV